MPAITLSGTPWARSSENTRVAQIMKALSGQLRGGDQRVEFFQDLAVVDGGPNGAREDESGVMPSRARELSLLVLAFPVRS